MRQYLIGIDLGTSGCKSIIMDDLGCIVASCLEGYPLNTPKPGWYEQDTAQWWQAVKSGIKKMLKGFEHVQDIKGIGLSGQMHGLVSLGKSHEVLRPCMIWADFRNEKQCRDVYERTGGEEGLLRYTNNKMLTGYTGGKILWVMENEPQIFEKMKFFLNPKDFIRLMLTGEIATEVSDASGTGLFNVRKREWSYELIDLLGIPREIFPLCYESQEVTGKLLKAVASEMGLPEGIPVIGGGGDAIIQSTGTGLTKEGIFGTTIGTGGIVMSALDRFYDNPGGNLQVFCNNMPDKWHTMGVMLGAGGALKWFKDILCEPEIKTAGLCGRDIYSILDEEASQAAPGAEGLMFLPFLLGQRCPHADSNARGAYVGFTPRHTRKHMLRSLMEGVIFSLRDMAELIEKMGVIPKEIRTTGGGAKSDFWRQIQADVFNLEVVTMSGAAEGGALGAALVAGAGTGVWPAVEYAAQVLKPETHNCPDDKRFREYEKIFPIYRELYGALKKTFSDIASL